MRNDFWKTPRHILTFDAWKKKKNNHFLLYLICCLRQSLISRRAVNEPPDSVISNFPSHTSCWCTLLRSVLLKQTCSWGFVVFLYFLMHTVSIRRHVIATPPTAAYTTVPDENKIIESSYSSITYTPITSSSGNSPVLILGCSLVENDSAKQDSILLLYVKCIQNLYL